MSNNQPNVHCRCLWEWRQESGWRRAEVHADCPEHEGGDL